MATITTHYDSLAAVRAFLDEHRRMMTERRDGEHGTRRYRDEARGQVNAFDIAIKALDDYLADHPGNDWAAEDQEEIRNNPEQVCPKCGTPVIRDEEGDWNHVPAYGVRTLECSSGPA